MKAYKIIIMQKFKLPILLLKELIKIKYKHNIAHIMYNEINSTNSQDITYTSTGFKQSPLFSSYPIAPSTRTQL